MATKLKLPSGVEVVRKIGEPGRRFEIPISASLHDRKPGEGFAVTLTEFDVAALANELPLCKACGSYLVECICDENPENQGDDE